MKCVCIEIRVDVNMPVVALESTVIAHGLPYPENIETANEMERAVAASGSVPATVGIINGKIIVGLGAEEKQILAKGGSMKAGVREVAYAVAKRLNADTTVSATMRIAALSGIKVFATGGIGGVHRGVFDISQDLVELSRNNLIVVSSGPKSILDLQKTAELLETLGVIVVGYRTDEFPAFYSSKSGIKLDMRVDNVEEIVAIYREASKMNYQASVLVLNPVPREYEIPEDTLERWIKIAVEEAIEKGIKGKSLTPYLLERLTDISQRATLKANISLLINNARLAGQIARALFSLR